MPDKSLRVYFVRCWVNGVQGRGLMAGTPRSISIAIGQSETYTRKHWHKTTDPAYMAVALSAPGKLFYAPADTHSAADFRKVTA